MNFDGSIIIVGDMGQLKAYRATNVVGMDRRDDAQVSHAQKRGVQKESTTLELVFDADYIESHKRMRDTVSDQAGNFHSATGEAHNTETEHEKRTLKTICEEIKGVIEKESPDKWYLAFPKELHNQLCDILPAQIKGSLTKSVPANLTKTAKEKLLSHFE